MTGPLSRPAGRETPGAARPASDMPRLDSPAADPLAADDPQGAIRAALAAASEPAGEGEAGATGAGVAARAEEILMAWLLGLAPGADPAVAAGRIVAVVDRATIRNDRLLRLLAEVARWPAARLAQFGRRRARMPRRVSE